MFYGSHEMLISKLNTTITVNDFWQNPHLAWRRNCACTFIDLNSITKYTIEICMIAQVEMCPNHITIWHIEKSKLPHCESISELYLQFSHVLWNHPEYASCSSIHWIRNGLQPWIKWDEWHIHHMQGDLVVGTDFTQNS